MLAGCDEINEEIPDWRCQTGNCDKIRAENGGRIRQSNLKRMKELQKVTLFA
jgi:hypothetical protein